jgi:hypothetical protein
VGYEDAARARRRTHSSGAGRALDSGSNGCGGVTHPDGREREVASLVTAGRCSREIADTLLISEGKAEVHVKHILSDRLPTALSGCGVGHEGTVLTAPHGTRSLQCGHHAHANRTAGPVPGRASHGVDVLPRVSPVHASFVGRGAELEQLKAAFAEAAGGQGALMLLGGEAGHRQDCAVRQFE